ncbi:MAG: hypothetical protein IPO19_15955 [Rhodoferax sp.]|nr:hypothetical protein [Rhodoferax sp.]
MHDDSTTTTPPTPARQAAAALRATTVDGKAQNAKQIAELTDGAVQIHIAEHIRGMVAATVAHASTNTSASTKADAAHWQHWALGTGRSGWRRTGGVSVRLNREANGRIGSLGQFAVGPNMWNPNSLARCGHS